jgi:cell division protein FtsQ
VLKRILIILVVLVGLPGGAWALWGLEATQLHEIRVVGNNRASEAQLRHLAALPIGAPLVDVDLNTAQATLQKHPWLKHVRVRRIFPDTVLIEVEERRVRALLLLGKQLFLVDEEGTPFRQAAPPDLDYPILTGLNTELAKKDPDLARRIIGDGLGWLAALDRWSSSSGTTAAVTSAQEPVNPPTGLSEELRRKFSSRDVSEVHFDSGSGYTLALRNGSEIRLGFLNQDVLSRIDVLVAEGLDLSKPHRIDLGFERIAVVTPL